MHARARRPASPGSTSSHGYGPPAPSSTPAEFVVAGKVQAVDGSPQSGVDVSAFDNDLRSSQFLGSTATFKDGTYSISYTKAKFQRAEKGFADLQVSAWAPTGEKGGGATRLAISKIVFNAVGPTTTIDLVVGGEKVLGPSEYDALLADIKPLLAELSPADLVENDEHHDISFLTGETGKPEEYIRYLITATQYFHQTKVAADIFYGLFRQGISTVFSTLILAGPSQLTRALSTAVEQHIIRELSQDAIKAVVAKIVGLGVSGSLQGVFSSKPTPLGATLNVAIPHHTELFVNLLAKHEGSPEEFWTSLESVPEFNGKVEKIQLSVQTGAVTLSHGPLVSRLLQDTGANPIKQFSDLARISESQWLSIINEPGIGAPDPVPGNTPAEKARNYARAISNLVEDAVPTAFVTNRLGDADDDEVYGPFHGKTDLQKVLLDNPKYDFISTRVPNLVADNPEALHGVQNPEAVTATIANFQRIYTVAPQYKQTRYLLANGVTSSMQISRMGRGPFVKQYAPFVGGEFEALKIWDNADKNQSMAISLISNFGFPSSNIPIHVWLNLGDLITKVTKTVPDWTTLFQSLDFCACEDCRAVDGPAAYLVDTLHYLKDRASVLVANTSVKEILFQRRADIEEVELTCQNTNTTLPYIDLALEVLENIISPLPTFTAYDLPAGSASLLDATKIEDLRSAFSPPLSQFAVLSVETKGQSWTVDEPAYTLRIAANGSTVSVTTRGRQTKGTAQERLADAQYTNSAAYVLLAQQVFPWKTPFNLWVETVRTYLSHLGVQRYELLEALSKGSRIETLENANVVQEYLRLDNFETAIVLGNRTDQPGSSNSGVWHLWGLAGDSLSATNSIPDPLNRYYRITEGPWNVVLTDRVDVFLQQSGMTYKDLLNIIEISRTFDPPSQISIEAHFGAPAATCTLSKLQIVGASTELLGQIVRFMRLLRKLDGWTLIELGKAFHSLGYPKGDDEMKTFLLRVSHVQRLRIVLQIPIESILVFWAPISVLAFADHDSDDEEARPQSLYSKIFRNETISKQPDQFFTADPSRLTGLLSDAAAPVMAALNVSSVDFALLCAPDSNVIQTDTLNLDNLSRLFRHSTLAKALGVSTYDYLSLLKLVTATPFATSTDTVKFAEDVAAIQGSKFSISELNYLLLHNVTNSSGVGIADEDVEAALTDVRNGLRQIVADTTYHPEIQDNGELTKKNLALLNWDTAVILQVTGTLLNIVPYSIKLEPPLATDPIFPASVRDKITYASDGSSATLTFSRAMTVQDRDDLLNQPGAAADFKTAIGKLFQAPRSFMSRNTMTFSVQDFSVDLVTVPTDVAIPPALKSKIYYDPTTQKLHSIGAVNEIQLNSLVDAATNSASGGPLAQAVKDLYDKADTIPSALDDPFLTASDVSSFLDAESDSNTAAARFAVVLQKLLPYLQERLISQTIKQKISQSVGFDTNVADALLTQYVKVGSQTAGGIFHEAAFISSNPNVLLTRKGFARQFQAYVLLFKIGMIVSKFKFTLKQLAWIYEFRKRVGDPTSGWLDLNAIPLAQISSGFENFAGWMRLNNLAKLRDIMGEAALDTVFKKARVTGTAESAILSDLAFTMQWPLEELQTLAGPEGFHLVPQTAPPTALLAAYQDEIALSKVVQFIQLARKVGCTASDGILLAKPDQDNMQARLDVQQKQASVARQCVKSKYDQTTWNSIAQPLRNILRDQQRAALVTCLLANPSPGQDWRGSSDLYAYLLMDVEMGPCQLTSRIKQAISSVQLFVQRCFMNLEPNVEVDPADEQWQEWTWMKSLPISSANRRMWMTPENFLDGSIRDDKTTFYQELESELQQGDLTSDVAETAYLNYLEKLDTVSRLEVVSYYHQVEPNEQVRTVDIMHIFCRTRGTPPAYYYIRWIDRSRWSGFQKVDADIAGNHLIPVIWNGRLYLFWAVMTEKAQKQSVKMPRPDQTLENPPTYWEVKIAWTELKNGKWLAKKIGDQSLQVPKGGTVFDEVDGDEENGRFLITFKAYPDQESGSLLILCLQNVLSQTFVGVFAFNGVNDSPAAWPQGNYYDNVYVKRKMISVLSPNGTSIYNMGFRGHLSGRAGVYFTEGDFSHIDAEEFFAVQSHSTQVEILTQNPGRPYELIVAHQDKQFSSQRPFFFQQNLQSFLVEVEYERTWITPVFLSEPSRASVSWLDGRLLKPYLERPPYINLTPRDTLNSEIAPISFTPALPVIPKFGSVELMSFRIPPILGGLTKKYKFSLFYHPYVESFIKALNAQGVKGLLTNRGLQIQRNVFFWNQYAPNGQVVNHSEVPDEVVDFEGGVFSVYNWETFFHIPILVADRLSQNQRFEDAQKWYHYVFNPTDTSSYPSPQRFWHLKRFFDTDPTTWSKTRDEESIENIMELLAKRGNPKALAALSPTDSKRLAELEADVDAWRKNPFDPFLVARTRTTAFQKSVVMKYLDNLIAWGDQLFRQDTIESINEATQLYILAADILGARPQEIPTRATPQVQTYKSIEPSLDSMANALVRIEEFMPLPRENAIWHWPTHFRRPATPTMLYFCVPKNSKLLGYWDTVADRLFKIRNCMNLQGIVRELRLFEPPIDPMLLIKARAAGLDLSSVLNDLNVSLSAYRFSTLAARATDLCNEVRVLGSTFLSALEKKDAAQLALLTSNHEISLIKATRQVMVNRLKEASDSLDAVKASKDVVQARVDHYNGLAFLNGWEIAHLALETVALVLQNLETAAQPVAAATILIPDAKLGAPTSIGLTFGGSNLGKSAEKFGDFINRAARVVQTTSTMTAEMATYSRRKEDWDLQIAVGLKELSQIDRQIAAAEVRQAIAQNELDNHDLQIQNATETNDYLKSRFNNVDLYDWMVSQLSSTFFQSYQLAYDMAKRAELAFRHELGLTDTSYINFGYWDSLKKGLISGDRLAHDIKKMEADYLDKDKREYEITKAVSLAQLDPFALVQLRETGTTFFGIPEAVFDMDYPGHYMRRIRMVSVTIPCVVGPYTTVASTLSLLKSSIRVLGVASGGKYARRDNDPRFTDSYGEIQSIVTSGGLNDAGLFEATLRDERYLPFERAGAISSWKMTLPFKLKPFDYDTISDVIIHIRYTAREAGDALKAQVETELQATTLNAIALAEAQSGLGRLFDVRREFPTLWYRFGHPPPAAASQAATLPLDRARFPFVVNGAKTLTIKAVDLFVRLVLPPGMDVKTIHLAVQNPAPATPTPTGAGAGAAEGTTPPLPTSLVLAPYAAIYRATKTLNIPAGDVELRGWVSAVGGGPSSVIADGILQDMWLVCHYTVTW